jgi:transposase InsO family protein
MYLIAVDAHSKWMEVAIVNSATSDATIEKLRSMFATHGLPETLVSDNGSQFTSLEFKTFMERNGIHHIKTAPYPMGKQSERYKRSRKP